MKTQDGDYVPFDRATLEARARFFENRHKAQNRSLLIAIFFLLGLIIFCAQAARADEYPIYVSQNVDKEAVKAQIFRDTGVRPPIYVGTPKVSEAYLVFKVSKIRKYPEFNAAGHSYGFASGSVAFIAKAYAYTLGCHKELSRRQCKSEAEFNIFALPYALHDVASIKRKLKAHNIPYTDTPACGGMKKDVYKYYTDPCCYYIYNNGMCVGAPKQ